VDPPVVREVIPISNRSVRVRVQARVDDQPDPLIRFGHSMAEPTQVVNLVTETRTLALGKTTSVYSLGSTRESPTLVHCAKAAGAEIMRRGCSVKTQSWSIRHAEIQPHKLSLATQCNSCNSMLEGRQAAPGMGESKQV
jgi:hypothetical protein